MFNTSKVEKILGIKIKNNDLFRQAFTHKSFDILNNNEKLEFLGDRIIAFVLSEKLIDIYQNDNEGVLDKKLAKLVNKNTCAKLIGKLNLFNFLYLGKAFDRNEKSLKKILGDLCEAVIAAIYLDHDYDYVKKFILKLWHKELTESKVTPVDPKTELQEYSLKSFKKLPNYKMEKSTGPKHKPLFKVSVKIIGSKKYFGIGESKQSAEQNAAKNLLKKINL